MPIFWDGGLPQDFRASRAGESHHESGHACTPGQRSDIKAWRWGFTRTLLRLF
ncbi:MAG: hypothetical protein ABIQ35_08755 [Verrucomicrobiota bacterium]